MAPPARREREEMSEGANPTVGPTMAAERRKVAVSRGEVILSQVLWAK